MCSFYSMSLLKIFLIVSITRFVGATTNLQEYEDKEKAKEIVEDLLEDQISKKTLNFKSREQFDDIDEHRNDNGYHDEDDEEEIDDDVDDKYLSDNRHMIHDPRAWWRNGRQKTSLNSLKGTSRCRQCGWRWRRIFTRVKKIYNKVRPFVPHIMTGAKALAAIVGKKRELERKRKKNDDNQEFFNFNKTLNRSL